MSKLRTFHIRQNVIRKKNFNRNQEIFPAVPSHSRDKIMISVPICFERFCIITLQRYKEENKLKRTNLENFNNNSSTNNKRLERFRLRIFLPAENHGNRT